MVPGTVHVGVQGVGHVNQGRRPQQHGGCAPIRTGLGPHLKPRPALGVGAMPHLLRGPLPAPGTRCGQNRAHGVDFLQPAGTRGRKQRECTLSQFGAQKPNI